MDDWNIRFLGVPDAHCSDRQARLRSKETWAVQTSLLVPSALRREAPFRLARETLGDRIVS